MQYFIGSRIHYIYAHAEFTVNIKLTGWVSPPPLLCPKCNLLSILFLTTDIKSISNDKRYKSTEQTQYRPSECLYCIYIRIISNPGVFLTCTSSQCGYQLGKPRYHWIFYILFFVLVVKMGPYESKRHRPWKYKSDSLPKIHFYS